MMVFSRVMILEVIDTLASGDDHYLTTVSLLPIFTRLQPNNDILEWTLNRGKRS